MLFLFYACGSGSQGPVNETGSIAFKIEWADSNARSIALKAIDCGSIGVSTVEASVYDENNNHLANGGPWECDDHEGTITGVQTGQDRKVVIKGRDEDGNILYQGEKTGITVLKDSTTEGGEIPALYFTSDLSLPPDGSTIVTGTAGFTWAGNWSSYEIQISTYDNNFDNHEIYENTTETSYTPGYPLETGTYYWRVRPNDNYGNEGMWSEVWEFTVSDIIAAGGNKQAIISWAEVENAISYNIYWSTSPNVTKDNGTKIADITSPYIHTDVENNMTYYYVLTVENDYGESEESNEVSAEPFTIHKTLIQ